MEYIACITDDADWNPAEPHVVPVYAPSVRGFPKKIALDVVSFPFANLNEQTAQFIRTLPEARERATYCAIFALDPFTQWKPLLDLVSNAGIRGICNFPPLPRFGKEEQEALEASGFSFERELELLGEIASRGFDIAVMCNSKRDVRQARDRLDGLTRVFCLVPKSTLHQSSGP